MARYIDLDELGIGKAERKMFDVPEYADGWNSAIEIIETAPTADVVPRSEYDAVVSAVDNSTKEFLKLHDAYQKQKIELEAMRGAANSYKLHYEQAKQEVVREYKELVKQYLLDRFILPVFVKNALNYAETELEKKYIGEKK